ncbi:lymphoid-specific helicase-like [Thrips palmi]|uniref:Lymphoid-specific helicase-like n=1 Tax=Thrips palmi TaxID=161013 RepID=A0A6P8XWY9_THRPL|nr:lymphoid-specific helicase-like [Thrips palmi]
MGKDDDPTFSISKEMASHSSLPRSKRNMSDEEYRESIIQRTMHALSVSEEFTQLLVKRMEQNENLQKQLPKSDERSSKGSARGRKRKANNAPSVKSKQPRSNEESVPSGGTTYINAQNLEVSIRQPKLLEGAIMRDYQLDGLEWLVALDLNGANGILADEMGLGKTVQVIALICFLVEMGVGGEAPFLVIGPLSTLHNWVAEFQNFAPKIPVLLYHGNQQQRNLLKGGILKKSTVGKADTYPVIITSYETPLRDKSLRKINWRYLIVDEGHRLKNHKCLLVNELRRFNTTNRLLLTGTPLQNNMTELWSLLNFILPNIVNDIDVFECWFDASFLQASDANEKIVEAEAKDKVVTTLHKILKPFLLRRVKADVGLNLPPKKEIIIYAQMTDWQNRLYSAIVEKTIYKLMGRKEAWEDPYALEKAARRSAKFESSDLEQEVTENDSLNTLRRSTRRTAVPVNSGDYKLLARGIPLSTFRDGPLFCHEDSWGPEESCDKLLEGLAGPDEEFITEVRIRNPVSALRQICNHPYLASFPVIPGTRMLKIDENIIHRSGKLQILDAMLTRLKRNGHKVLIFSNFKIMLDIIEDYFIMKDYQYTRLDGSCDLADRQESIKKFNSEDDVFGFLISTRAGGLGINLVAADTVIIYDSDWNPQCDLQAQDRCHRIGQTKPVAVYRFVVRGTMDEHLVNCAEKKKQLDKVVIQHGKFKNIKKNDVVSLDELRNLLQPKDKTEAVFKNGLVYSEEELDVLCDRNALFSSKLKDEVDAELDDAPSIHLSDIDSTSECSDSQDAISLSSHTTTETNSTDSGFSGSSAF